jgi:hypothetical protein
VRMSLDSYGQAESTIRHKNLQADPQSERTSLPRERQCDCKCSSALSSGDQHRQSPNNHLAAAQLPHQPQTRSTVQEVVTGSTVDDRALLIKLEMRYRNLTTRRSCGEILLRTSSAAQLASLTSYPGAGRRMPAGDCRASQ